MNWYLIHTKPRQEILALENLERQGYNCYLPLFVREKVQQGNLMIVEEPLFPRYLFIELDESNSGKSWAPIRSTRGVSRLVSFGIQPAKVDGQLVNLLKRQEATTAINVKPLFNPGDAVSLTSGAFAGIKGIYEMKNGEQRAIVLIEILSKTVRLNVYSALLRRAV